jgi:hypothetical protein
LNPCPSISFSNEIYAHNTLQTNRHQSLCHIRHRFGWTDHVENGSNALSVWRRQNSEFPMNYRIVTVYSMSNNRLKIGRNVKHFLVFFLFFIIKYTNYTFKLSVSDGKEIYTFCFDSYSRRSLHNALLVDALFSRCRNLHVYVYLLTNDFYLLRLVWELTFTWCRASDNGVR